VGALVAFARANPLVAPLGGLASVGSYGIALWAMTRAPVAAVAALRETSILFATAIAAFILREPIGRARLAAVTLIACGAVAMRLACPYCRCVATTVTTDMGRACTDNLAPHDAGFEVARLSSARVI